MRYYNNEARWGSIFVVNGTQEITKQRGCEIINDYSKHVFTDEKYLFD